MIVFALLLYVAAITSANLLVATFGPWVSPINALVLIGLDLTLRDWLHVRVRPWQMATLIGGAGALTYLLNPAAGTIAVASACAFSAAALVDWAVFLNMRGSWLRRANGSNVAAAAVDSILFPTIAFGALLPHVIFLQFIAKVAGGAAWAWLFNIARERAERKAA